MRPITMMMAQWKSDIKEGKSLEYNNCKGGYFSNKDEYGLKVIGKTAQNGTPTPDATIPFQKVSKGTIIHICGENLMADDMGMVNANVKREYGRFECRIDTVETSYLYGAPIIPLTIHLNQGTYYFGFNLKNSPVSLTNVRIVYDDNGTEKSCRANSFFIIDSSATIKFVRMDTIFLHLNEVIEWDGWITKGENITDYKKYFGLTINTPCDLYEGDIYYPMSGKVERWGQIVDAVECHINVLDSLSSTNLQRALIVAPHDSSKRAYCTHFKYNSWAVAQYSFTASESKVNIYVNTKGLHEEFTIQAIKDWFDSQKENGNPVLFFVGREEAEIEQYEPQPIFAPSGIVNIIQISTELEADLSAMMIVRR